MPFGCELRNIHLLHTIEAHRQAKLKLNAHPFLRRISFGGDEQNGALGGNGIASNAITNLVFTLHVYFCLLICGGKNQHHAPSWIDGNVRGRGSYSSRKYFGFIPLGGSVR